jgi:S-adenosylmethionine hydrolase
MSLMPSEPVIALLTDFGNDDPFVGIMKGVISNIAPQVKLIDITNKIPPGDIRRAAVTLWQSIPFFPPGSIFLTVVDPGVGTNRRGMLVQAGDYIFVGPDNGVFTYARQDEFIAWELQESQFQLAVKGNTFHGRDIFAPAAAHAANGIEGDRFGSKIVDLVLLTNPQLQVAKNKIYGEVLYSDQFGNLLTSLGLFSPSDERSFRFDPWINRRQVDFEDRVISKYQSTLSLPGGKTLLWVDTFSDLQDGECGFLVGSSGLIEIVANQNNAGELLNINSGAQLTLNF